MKLSQLLLLLSLLGFGGCFYAPPEPIKVELQKEEISYLDDIKPILDKRCVTCHSCYNSPCQAKFSSFEGIDRGASKDKVYLAERLFAQEPSRLFIDEKSTEAWRKKDFFSLTDTGSKKGYDNSIMGHLLNDKMLHPELSGDYSPEKDKLLCPQTLQEVSEYLDKKKNHGMPYGFPALEKDEYKLIMAWLAQGAKGPSLSEQIVLEKPSNTAKLEIKKWEEFLNTNDAKHKLTARYLYEHYFLAHLNFIDEPKEFYRLVRSRTPSGEKIDEIATVRPFDDPKYKTFYYRFLKIHSTLVHKTHIVVVLDEDELSVMNELFIEPKWEEEPHEMSYEAVLSANPFLVYAQIPSASRYQFLLNHSEYVIRTFIRGPVCKGQIALNVIHDHFWVMFQDPKHDIGIMDPNFLKEQASNLAMPIEGGSEVNVFRAFSDLYKDRYAQYYQAKIDKTSLLMKHARSTDGIWRGEKAKDAPALTIYRHFDSASVHKGLVGELPRTMWVIDYAHFERIYYTLVAGYDVFGNLAHQTNIRRYMDYLRLEGEMNFLVYLPNDQREQILNSWYVGDNLDDLFEENQVDISTHKFGTGLTMKSEHPKVEFIEDLVNNHFFKETNIHFDDLNYLHLGEKPPSLPTLYKTTADLQVAFKALTAPCKGFIKKAVSGGINLIHVRIVMNDGREEFFSFVINRWHDNVNSLFGEEDRLNASKDSLDVFKGSIGSYPNVYVDLKEDELADFFNMMIDFKQNEKYHTKMNTYTVSRNNPNFWNIYDWFQKRFYEDQPLESGLYDLNRYDVTTK